MVGRRKDTLLGANFLLGKTGLLAKDALALTTGNKHVVQTGQAGDKQK